MLKGKNYYSTKEAANLLEVSVSTIQTWSNEGVLKAWKTVGGHRRISKANVDKMLDNLKEVTVEGSISEKLRIVIIEDDAQQTNLYKQHLEHLKDELDIVFTDNGYDGLIQIGLKIPQIIICDLSMPNLSGFDVLKSIESQPELKDTLKLIISALSLLEAIEIEELPKSINYIQKPVDYNQLRKIIQQKIDSQKTSQQQH